MFKLFLILGMVGTFSLVEIHYSRVLWYTKHFELKLYIFVTAEGIILVQITR